MYFVSWHRQGEATDQNNLYLSNVFSFVLLVIVFSCYSELDQNKNIEQFSTRSDRIKTNNRIFKLALSTSKGLGND
jgi:hypothetical protein